MALSKVQRSAVLGGLGIMDLKIFGCALQVWWLWLQRTAPERARTKLSTVIDKETVVFLNTSTRLIVGNGATTLFWSAPWLDGRSSAELAPKLSRRGRRSHSIADAIQNRSWVHDISGGLTIPVHSCSTSSCGTG